MGSTDSEGSRGRATSSRVRVALVLGGGGARGLAHIGVLEVLAQQRIPVDFIAGSSIGGLIGALHSSGLSAPDLIAVASGFRFPRWFLPGALLHWDSLFPSAPCRLAERFENLVPPLAIAALDLEEGTQVILHRGPVLPAVRATCAVPGVLPPVRLGGRWLVDGGLVNVLPTDIAWIANPDVVISVRVGAPHQRRLPELGWGLTSTLSPFGRLVPNPATAKLSLEVLLRTTEIVLERQAALIAAMAGPEVLIEPALGNLGLRDFQRLDEAVAAGRRAARSALPRLERLLASPPARRPEQDCGLSLFGDPVCGMAVNPVRARASLVHDGKTYLFCSSNCLDCFGRDPDRYLGEERLTFLPAPDLGVNVS